MLLAAAQALRDVLTDYFEKKKDRLSHATVAAVLCADGASAAAAPALARYAGGARSEFLRLEAAQLLLGLLRPPRVRGLPTWQHTQTLNSPITLSSREMPAIRAPAACAWRSRSCCWGCCARRGCARCMVFPHVRTSTPDP